MTDEAAVFEGFGGQAQHGEPGQVKPHSRQASEVLWAHDRQRMERRNTVYDSENDYYLQEWRDLHTGEVT